MSSFRLYVYGLIVKLLPETRGFALKRVLLRWCGAKVGRNVRICSTALISGVGALHIGDDVWIGPQCFLAVGSPAAIRIGNHVDIAPGVYISTGSHQIDTGGAHTAGKGTNESIDIEDGAWIGARAVILPGVCVGGKTAVGAGAIVTKSIPAAVVAVGCPARVVRKLGDVK